MAVRCNGITQKGTQCKFKCIENCEKCKIHIRMSKGGSKIPIQETNLKILPKATSKKISDNWKKIAIETDDQFYQKYYKNLQTSDPQIDSRNIRLNIRKNISEYIQKYEENIENNKELNQLIAEINLTLFENKLLYINLGPVDTCDQTYPNIKILKKISKKLDKNSTYKKITAIFKINFYKLIKDFSDDKYIELSDIIIAYNFVRDFYIKLEDLKILTTPENQRFDSDGNFFLKFENIKKLKIYITEAQFWNTTTKVKINQRFANILDIKNNLTITYDYYIFKNIRYFRKSEINKDEINEIIEGFNKIRKNILSKKPEKKMSPQRPSFSTKCLSVEIYKIFNMDFSDKNSYILTKKSTFEDFKKKYRILCLKYHPDKNKNPDSLEKMKTINESFSKVKTFYNM